jgi:hypothetical protein
MTTEVGNSFLRDKDPEELLQEQFNRFAHAADVLNGAASFGDLPSGNPQIDEALNTFVTVSGLTHAIRQKHRIEI